MLPVLESSGSTTRLVSKRVGGMSSIVPAAVLALRVITEVVLSLRITVCADKTVLTYTPTTSVGFELTVVELVLVSTAAYFHSSAIYFGFGPGDALAVSCKGLYTTVILPVLEAFGVTVIPVKHNKSPQF